MDAPSEVWDELAAVTDPLGLKAGLSAAMPSRVVSKRGALVRVESELFDLKTPGLRVEGLFVHLKGDDLVLEPAFLDGGHGPHLTLISESVLVLARDAVTVGHVFCGQPHGFVRAGMGNDHVQVGVGHVAAHGNQAHAFHAACDNAVGLIGHNAFAGLGDGLQAGGTETVDGHAGHFIGQSGRLGQNTAQVQALLRFRKGASDNDIVDIHHIQAGRAAEHFLDHGHAHLFRPGFGENASGRLAHCGAHGRDDDCFFHGVLLISSSNCRPT